MRRPRRCRRCRRPARPAKAGATVWTRGAVSACARLARHASRSGAQSRPSASNSRAVAARDAPRLRGSGRAGRARSAASRARAGRTARARATSPGIRTPRRRRRSRTRCSSSAAWQAAEPPPLRGQPAVESRVAVDLQALEEVAVEQCGQRPQALRSERLDALLRSPGRPRRIDEAVREIEPDGVAAGLDPPPAGLVDDAPDLAEAPAQLAARIVRARPTAARTAGCA